MTALARNGSEAASPTTAIRERERRGSAAMRWWRGRYGFLLMRECTIVVALLLLYRLGRYLARDHAESAYHHAHAVLRFERQIGLAIEDDVQSLALEHRWLIQLLGEYYARVHLPATMFFLVALYVRAPVHYLSIRRLLAGVTGLALVMQITYPLAPPRMMPGFVDTLAIYGPAIYERADIRGVANQYAAMPSLHFGWAVIVAYGVIRATRVSWRSIIVIHPAFTLVAIVATANHYWIDAAVAALLVGGMQIAIERTARSDADAEPDSRSRRRCPVALRADTGRHEC